MLSIRQKKKKKAGAKSGLLKQVVYLKHVRLQARDMVRFHIIG
jgi:hypothetical protein